MICLRCGHCCIEYDVVIVKGYLKVKSLFGKDGNLAEGVELIYKEGGKVCPHLSFENEQAVCSVHDAPWYKQTPCFAYTQTERRNSPCRMGKYLRENKEGQQRFYKQLSKYERSKQ